jgi:hypothetical protein
MQYLERTPALGTPWPKPRRRGGVAIAITLALFGSTIAVSALVKANRAGADAQATAHEAAPTDGAGAGVLTSYASAGPADAVERAAAHVPFPAALPAVPAGPVANVHLTLRDVVGPRSLPASATRPGASRALRPARRSTSARARR